MTIRHATWLLLIGAIALLAFFAIALLAARKVPPNIKPVIVKLTSTAQSRQDVHPSEHYIAYSKNEHFVSSKNEEYANRYRRYVALSTTTSNTSDLAIIDRDASETSRNENKGKKLKKITLYNDRQKHVKLKNTVKPREDASRARRSVVVDDDYQLRRNTSDYYAKRKALMERYYARQREINARYAANRTNYSGIATSTSRPDDTPRGAHMAVTRNTTLVRFGREYLSGLLNTAPNSRAIFRRPSVTIDPVYNQENSNGRSIASRLYNRQPDTDNGLRFDRDNAPLDYTTPTTCANAPLAGIFTPKTRSKQMKNCTEPERGDQEPDRMSTAMPVNENDVRTDHQRWGECTGKIVYQHNLLLGLWGPGILDTLFEVIIQGPICITCAETLRYNKTRALVSLESGGRGHEYAKFRLRGYENEGFSYIIKIWGVKKNSANCTDL